MADKGLNWNSNGVIRLCPCAQRSCEYRIMCGHSTAVTVKLTARDAVAALV